MPISARYSVRSSAIRFVRVVTRIRSFAAARFRISPVKSSIWFFTGRISTSGSTNPVGRITCSTKAPLHFSISYGPGVALTKITWLTNRSHSSNLRGRLSSAEGSRKPYFTSVSLRDRSPKYIPPICGTLTWDSSITSKKSFGK